MNIFYLDKNIKLCAQAHVDKHVSKLILEAAQMMGTAIRHSMGEPQKIKYMTVKGTPSKNYKNVYVLPGDKIELVDGINTITEYQDLVYLNSYEKHPCTLWVQKSLSNYEWLYNLCYELNEECLYRGYKQHMSWDKMQNWPKPALPDIGLTPHAKAFTQPFHDEGMQMEDTLEAYRAYYMFGKTHLLQYTKRKPPEWLVPDLWVFKNDKYQLI